MLLRSLDGAESSEVMRMPLDATRYAQRLYAALHELDEIGCRVIYVERVPDGAEWTGVRDRLERATRP
jgi:L-threonylcarbamoyladenylate synthase